MANGKSFLSGKANGWYVECAALIFGVITLIVYTARGGNSYSPVSGAAVATLVIGIVFNVLALIKDFKVGGFLPVVFYAVTLAILLNTEMLFLSNVLTGIDNNKLDAAFIVFVVTIILALITSIVAFSMKLSKDE